MDGLDSSEMPLFAPRFLLARALLSRWLQPTSWRVSWAGEEAARRKRLSATKTGCIPSLPAGFMSEFKLKRLGVVMEPEPGNPLEAEGVLNRSQRRARRNTPIRVLGTGWDGETEIYARQCPRNCTSSKRNVLNRKLLSSQTATSQASRTSRRARRYS
jgi:hypothetical protein